MAKSAAVDGVDLSVERAARLALLVSCRSAANRCRPLSVMRLVTSPAIASGEILFEGKNLLDLAPAEMREIRGNRIAMIFQEPMTSLNPVFTVGDQITEAMRRS